MQCDVLFQRPLPLGFPSFLSHTRSIHLASLLFTLHLFQQDAVRILRRALDRSSRKGPGHSTALSPSDLVLINTTSTSLTRLRTCSALIRPSFVTYTPQLLNISLRCHLVLPWHPARWTLLDHPSTQTSAFGPSWLGRANQHLSTHCYFGPPVLTS